MFESRRVVENQARYSTSLRTEGPTGRELASRDAKNKRERAGREHWSDCVTSAVLIVSELQVWSRRSCLFFMRSRFYNTISPVVGEKCEPDLVMEFESVEIRGCVLF